MTVLLYLIPLALILSLVGLGAFFWSLKNNQYDDLDGAARRILLDDESPQKPGAQRSEKATGEDDTAPPG